MVLGGEVPSANPGIMDGGGISLDLQELFCFFGGGPMHFDKQIQFFPQRIQYIVLENPVRSKVPPGP